MCTKYNIFIILLGVWCQGEPCINGDECPPGKVHL